MRVRRVFRALTVSPPISLSNTKKRGLKLGLRKNARPEFRTRDLALPCISYISVCLSAGGWHFDIMVYSRNSGYQQYRGSYVYGNRIRGICVCAGTGFEVFPRDAIGRERALFFITGFFSEGAGFRFFTGLRDTRFRPFHGITGQSRIPYNPVGKMPGKALAFVPGVSLGCVPGVSQVSSRCVFRR